MAPATQRHFQLGAAAAPWSPLASRTTGALTSAGSRPGVATGLTGFAARLQLMVEVGYAEGQGDEAGRVCPGDVIARRFFGTMLKQIAIVL